MQQIESKNDNTGQTKTNSRKKIANCKYIFQEKPSITKRGRKTHYRHNRGIINNSRKNPQCREVQEEGPGADTLNRILGGEWGTKRKVQGNEGSTGM